ncbi:MAG: hypothetical protein L6Q57_06540 [Alphaproteobacteria bacterium]|nr:hypothetical protein [Alphaproteobacteria bacterium]
MGPEQPRPSLDDLFNAVIGPRKPRKPQVTAAVAAHVVARCMEMGTKMRVFSRNQRVGFPVKLPESHKTQEVLNRYAPVPEQLKLGI